MGSEPEPERLLRDRYSLTEELGRGARRVMPLAGVVCPFRRCKIRKEKTIGKLEIELDAVGRRHQLANGQGQQIRRRPESPTIEMS
jgi:hypothetical protein